MNNKDQVQVRVLSEHEHAKTAAAPLTTTKLLEKIPLIQPVWLSFPDGDEFLVLVRRLNTVELFANLGAYSLIKIEDDGKVGTDSTKTLDELRLTDVKHMQEALVISMVEAEVFEDGSWKATDKPLFKYKDGDGDGYPVESLTHDMLKLYFAAFEAVNAPVEAQEIYRRFHTTEQDGETETADTDESEASGTDGAEILHTDTAGEGNLDVSESGVSD